MSFFRIVAVLIVAAIANPWCCCYAGSSDMEDTVSYHGCCEASKDMTSEGEQSPGHSPENCQHMIDRDAQINHSVDSGDSLHKLAQALILDLPTFLRPSELDLQSKSSNKEGFASVSLPDTPFAQAYCVYLL